VAGGGPGHAVGAGADRGPGQGPGRGGGSPGGRRTSPPPAGSTRRPWPSSASSAIPPGPPTRSTTWRSWPSAGRRAGWPAPGRRRRPAAPARTRGSSPAWRTGGGRRSARSGAPSDWSTSEVSPSRASTPSAPGSHTASADSSVQPPANTDSRASSRRSVSVSRSWLQAMAPRRVRCRSGRVLAPVVSRVRRCWSRGRIWAGVSTLVRVAASSMARGSPSSRAAISATAGTFSVVSRNSGRTAWARSTNSAVASSGPSGGTTSSCSPRRARVTREVASTLIRGAAPSSRSITEPGRDLPLHQDPGGVGDDHLASGGRPGDPGRPVHVDAAVVVPAQGPIAGVQGHPHPHRPPRRPVVGGQASLGGHRGPDRRHRAGEGDEERVALGADLDPSPSRIAWRRITCWPRTAP
jgi:hypothetical protein